MLGQEINEWLEDEYAWHQHEATQLSPNNIFINHSPYSPRKARIVSMVAYVVHKQRLRPIDTNLPNQLSDTAQRRQQERNPRFSVPLASMHIGYQRNIDVRSNDISELFEKPWGDTDHWVLTFRNSIYRNMIKNLHRRDWLLRLHGWFRLPKDESHALRDNIRPDFFVVKINSIAEDEGIIPALREMYNELDELLLAKHFAQCNEILRIVNPHHTSLKILIGYLTITLPWRQNLAERGPLVQRIRQAALKQLSNARVDSLLKGLE